MWIRISQSTILATYALATILFATPYHGSIGQVPYQAIFQQVAGPRWTDRAAQIQAESGFNPRAVSSVGAKGLGQAMDTTWAWYQKAGWVPKGASPFDPQPAIMGQSRYMLWLEPRVSGVWHAALGGYNAGLGTVDKAIYLAKTLGIPGVDPWLIVLPKVSGPANAKQTQEYIVHNDTNLAAINRRLK